MMNPEERIFTIFTIHAQQTSKKKPCCLQFAARSLTACMAALQDCKMTGSTNSIFQPIMSINSCKLVLNVNENQNIYLVKKNESNLIKLLPLGLKSSSLILTQKISCQIEHINLLYITSPKYTFFLAVLSKVSRLGRCIVDNLDTQRFIYPKFVIHTWKHPISYRCLCLSVQIG